MLKAARILLQTAEPSGKEAVADRIELLTTLVVGGIVLVLVVMLVSMYRKRRKHGAD